MASVTAVLPLHNEFQNNRLRWQDFANGLIDVSALRADAGTAWIVRFQPSGNGADFNNNIQIRTGGDTRRRRRHIERSATVGRCRAVRFLCHDFSAGHDRLGACRPEPSERGRSGHERALPVDTRRHLRQRRHYLQPAGTHPQCPAAGLAGWVGDFKTTYAADNSVRATLTIDDGETPAVTPEALAGLVTAGEPVVSGNLRAIASTTPEALAGLVDGRGARGKRQPAGDRCISDPARTGDDGHRRG